MLRRPHLVALEAHAPSLIGLRSGQTLPPRSRDGPSGSRWPPSHDLRAPLRAIDGFVGALMEDYHATQPGDDD